MTLNEKVKNFKYKKRHLSQLKIRQSIEAMEKLIVIYQGEKEISYCPFCRILEMCELCPWIVLTSNNNCISLRWVIQEGNAPQRIKQLRHWIKAYQDNLK